MGKKLRLLGKLATIPYEAYQESKGKKGSNGSDKGYKKSINEKKADKMGSSSEYSP